MKINESIKRLFSKTGEPANKVEPKAETSTSLRGRRLSTAGKEYPYLNYDEEEQARKALNITPQCFRQMLVENKFHRQRFESGKYPP